MPRSIHTSVAAVVCPLLLVLAGCAGQRPVPPAVRAGDTIALYTGWKHHFERNHITVTFSDAAGATTVYEPGDDAVRAVVNKYPDPVSNLVVGTRTGVDTIAGGDGSPATHFGRTYGSVINGTETQNDPDWWETTIYLDTPATLAPGTAHVEVSSSDGGQYGPVPLEIRDGPGASATFAVDSNGALSPVQLHSLERMDHYTVGFTGGDTVPAALELWLTHDPDRTAGGAYGQAIAVNPRGESKNLAWSDDGVHMHVLLTPSGDGTWHDPDFPSTVGLKYWKFYVTGGVTGVRVDAVKAFDRNGMTISGVEGTVRHGG